MRLVRMVDPGRPNLGLLQDPLCMMKVVKSLNLRNINLIGNRGLEHVQIPLMARHMESIIV
ncbi:hypothetical protein SDC9_206959 [bioreactor metagenome]|uniref:Uncharacterized protein n=1 Tax=bioreactor metagenome TaxID=1076179 RepID=A0A645J6F3_9ZZZZ